MKDRTIIGYDRCLCEGCKIYRKEKGIPEPVTAYDAEVRRIAEVLAKWRYIKEFVLWAELQEAIGKQWDKCEKIEQREKEMYINSKMEEARAMVAEMAEVFKTAYMIADPSYADTDHVGFYNSIGEYTEGNSLHYSMVERGLIPA